MDNERIASDLEAFDGEFVPNNPFRTKNVDDMPEGLYELIITSIELARTEKKQDLILRWMLMDAKTQMTYEKVNFFTSQQNVDILGAELVSLGIDADKWKRENGRPFSQELPKAVARMKGIHFAAEKQIRKVNNKLYHNLLIRTVLPSTTTPRPPDNLFANGATPPTSLADALSNKKDEEVPF